MTKGIVLLHERWSKRKYENVAFPPTVRLLRLRFSVVPNVSPSSSVTVNYITAQFELTSSVTTCMSLYIIIPFLSVCRSDSLSCGTRRMFCFLYRWTDSSIDSLNTSKTVVLRIGFQKRGFKAKTLLRRGFSLGLSVDSTPAQSWKASSVPILAFQIFVSLFDSGRTIERNRLQE